MKSLLILALLATMIADLGATIRLYSPLDVFILKADVIAIVEAGPAHPDLGYPNPDHKSGYIQMTNVTVKQTLKGVLPANVKIFHGRELDDHLFQQGKGTYLIFLTRTPGTQELVPFDGWPSSKLITDQKVQGWNDSHNYWKEKGTPLEEVLSRIIKRLCLADNETHFNRIKEQTRKSFKEWLDDMMIHRGPPLFSSWGSYSQPGPCFLPSRCC